MAKRQKNLTIKTIVNYCPQCKTLPKLLERSNDSVLVAMECLKHQPKFVKTGTIMVPKNFHERFKEITQSAVLSSQEI